MSDRVNFDCRPGDVIAFPEGNAWVARTFPDGIILRFPETDGRELYYDYRSLIARRVVYVTKGRPDRPTECGEGEDER